MWSALENIALRESLPAPLQAGEAVHDILVSGQLPFSRYNLHHLGRRRSRPYLLKQFYSLNTDAFLCWQNEARFIGQPEVVECVWPVEEWKGGLITPFPDGTQLDIWLEEKDRPLSLRLAVAADISRQLARLHASGIAHRGLSPSAIRIRENGITLTQFGQARCDVWDDLWTDTPLSARRTAYASPERLCGMHCGREEDVHAFGSIFHLLLTLQPAFTGLRRYLRPLFPNFIKPDEPADDERLPKQITALCRGCLAIHPDDRPTADEVSRTLQAFGSFSTSHDEPITINTQQHPIRPRKTMVFIGNDAHASRLFEEAIRTGRHTPSLFLFVGLIPGNLPSGHAERYKAKMFAKLGQGLLRCREAPLSWSLRIMENTVPEKAAYSFAQHYKPDNIFIGGSSSKNRHGTRFHTALARTDKDIVTIS